MLIAFFSDIHANREALEACLADARAAGAERLVFLGDYVGYGADPNWCVERIAEEVQAGAIALIGNHDRAALDGPRGMNTEATIASLWTRARLTERSRRFLAGLPLSVTEDDRFYVHAEASAPARWFYVTDAASAGASLAASPARIVFCGHVHVPALYSLLAGGEPIPFRPVTGVSVPLLARRRWLAVVGSVGQPRDGNPAAAYALYDTTKNEITYRRAAYDCARTVAKIRAAGLPERLAARLLVGH